MPTLKDYGKKTVTGDLRVNGAAVVIGTLTANGALVTPGDGTLALGKLVHGTDGQIPIANTGGAVAYAALSGDVTMTAAGVVSLAPTLVHAVTVTLTNAQIKALRATPVQLVAGPGAGSYLELISCKLLLLAGTNVLTESTANLAVRYTNGSGVQASQTIEMTGFIDQSVNTVTNALPAINTIIATSAASAAPLVLHNEGGGEFAGNVAADATMKVTTVYRVHLTT